MNIIEPFKYWNKKLDRRDKHFKQLSDNLVQREYTSAMAKGMEFNNIHTRKPDGMTERLAVLGLFVKHFDEIFKKQRESKAIILNTFEASFHSDPSWNDTLFLSVVLKGCDEGHVIFGDSHGHTNPNKHGSKFMSLKVGDVFILDPLSIHSVHCKSPVKKEIVMLQYELSFGTRERACRVMDSLDWGYVNV